MHIKIFALRLDKIGRGFAQAKIEDIWFGCLYLSIFQIGWWPAAGHANIHTYVHTRKRGSAFIKYAFTSLRPLNWQVDKKIYYSILILFLHYNFIVRVMLYVYSFVFMLQYCSNIECNLSIPAYFETSSYD